MVFCRHADLAENHWQANDKNLQNLQNLHAQ
jgi:hypothetical protein